MNARRINRILTNKHKELMNSITDPSIRDLIKQDAIITGGAIASLLISVPARDFDIYFSNKKTTLAVAKYFVEQFNANRAAKEGVTDNDKTGIPYVYVAKDKSVVEECEDFDRVRIMIKSAGIASENVNESEYQYFESQPEESGEGYVAETMRNIVQDADEIDGGLIDTLGNPDEKTYRPIFLTDNAITLSDKVQLVTRFFGTPQEIHSNFDYVHCTNYWVSKDKKLYLSKSALESILTKELKYIGSKYPIASIIRLRRLLRKGWFVNAGQILKICLQISKLDLEDISVLGEQLTGIDTAYFFEMIQKLKEKQEKEDTISMPYIISIIDKIF